MSCRGWSSEREDIIIAISRQRDLIKWAWAILSPWLLNPSLFHPTAFVCISLISHSFLSSPCPSLSVFMVDGLGSAVSCACCFSLFPIAFVPRLLWLTAWAVLVKEGMAVQSMCICREEAGKPYTALVYTIVLFKLKLYIIQHSSVRVCMTMFMLTGCVTDCVKCSGQII